MDEGQGVPLLLQMMFGENAALAQTGASRRLLRWCRAMDGWLAERQRSCVEKTYRSSIAAWKRLLSRLGVTPWEIGPQDLAAHMAWMLASGYAASTISNEVGMLSSFYDWCAQHGIDPQCSPGFNPAAGVPRPKAPVVSPARVLSRAEVRALLGILKRDGSIIGKRDYAFFTARLRCGVSLKKLQQLQWGQIERGESGVWLRLGAGERRMPCPEEVWAAVSAYLEAAGRLDSIQPGDYIFAPRRDPLKHEARGLAGDWDQGRFLEVAQWRKNLKIYGRLAGIADEKLTLPALRRTAVRLRVEAGDSPEEIHVFMGTGAQLRTTKAYLKQLPPLQSGDIPAGAQGHPADEQPPLPDRKPNRFKPGENYIHGVYAHTQPVEEVEALLAEDLQGMEDEFIGLREIARVLMAAQVEAQTGDEVARLASAYTQAAARLGQISIAERGRAEPNEQDGWVAEVLAMLDQVEGLEDGGENVGELPSEEFWRTLAESDPEMGAASVRLTEEIASMRVVLRRLYNLVMGTSDVNALVRYAEKYGLGCIRLSRLLESKQGPEGRAAQVLREMIDETILEVNKEWGLDLGGGG